MRKCSLEKRLLELTNGQSPNTTLTKGLFNVKSGPRKICNVHYFHIEHRMADWCFHYVAVVRMNGNSKNVYMIAMKTAAGLKASRMQNLTGPWNSATQFQKSMKFIIGNIGPNLTRKKPASSQVTSTSSSNGNWKQADGRIGVNLR